MPANPPEGYARVSPYLLYADMEAALAFLAEAFGFTERMRLPMPDGQIGHAEMELEGGVIMMGWPGPDYKNPKTQGGATVHVYAYVDDVDAHFARAKAAGATIIAEPETMFYGDRVYRAEDPEGHHWGFATHVKDVAPEDMKPPA